MNTVIEDFSGSICHPKWRNDPQSFEEAKAAVKGQHCPICGSGPLLAIIRPPVELWKAHCNHCGSEVPIAVILNLKAWRAE